MVFGIYHAKSELPMGAFQLDLGGFGGVFLPPAWSTCT